MNKLSLWKHDELLEEHNNVSNVNFSDGHLSFISEEGDNELTGLNPEVVVCLHSDEDEINSSNYREYELTKELTQQEILESQVSDLSDMVSQLKKQLEEMQKVTESTNN